MTDTTRRIQEMIAALSSKGASPAGIQTLVGLLNRLDRTTEQLILKGIAQKDPELADRIRNEYLTFEDIVTLPDRAVQQALGDVDRHTLALALKGTGDDIRGKVLRNLSRGAANLLQDEMEYMGPRPRREVEEAQKTVTGALRRWNRMID